MLKLSKDNKKSMPSLQKIRQTNHDIPIQRYDHNIVHQRTRWRASEQVQRCKKWVNTLLQTGIYFAGTTTIPIFVVMLAMLEIFLLFYGYSGLEEFSLSILVWIIYVTIFTILIPTVIYLSIVAITQLFKSIGNSKSWAEKVVRELTYLTRAGLLLITEFSSALALIIVFESNLRYRYYKIYYMGLP